MLDGAKRYVDAFRAPLQGLTLMKSQQVHALRACSLVAIPPSEERMPPPGGFPKDLSCMNLTSWAGLIQDVAQGMKVVPPNLSMEVCLEAMVLLQLLEATTGMGYCRICSQPSPRCHCKDDQYAPTVTWSQMMARIKGKEGQPPLEAPPLLELPPLVYRSKKCFRLRLASNHWTSPNGAYLSLRLQRPGDYRRLQGFCPALEIRPQAHGPLDRRPQHCRCRHQALPREHCRFISRDYPSLLHLPSRQHSCRADLLLLRSSRCSHRASLLHRTNRPCSHPGGQQEGDCWLDLPQTELLLPLTLPIWTGEGNKLGDGASEADRPVALEGDEG